MTKTAIIYGDGLYSLAKEENLTDVIRDELENVRAVLRENPEYLKLLDQPVLSKETRVELIDEAFGASVHKYVLNFLKLLCENRAASVFSECCDEYTKNYNADNNITEACVYSAVSLDDEHKSALVEKLEGISGKTVILKEKITPSVIAGVKIEMDGRMYDGTLKGRLEGISKKLSDITL